VTNGTGSAMTVTNTNNSNAANTLNVTSNGPGVIADHSAGNAGNFFMNNTTGVGAGVRGEVNSIFGNNGTAGIYGVASGTGGYAGYFTHTDTTGFGISLYVTTFDKGTAFVVDHEGASGDPAIFQTGGANKARIDRNGKGFFNGDADRRRGSGRVRAGDGHDAGSRRRRRDRPGTPRQLPPVERRGKHAGRRRDLDGTEHDHERHRRRQRGHAGPALALAGRIPVKVTNEGGPIGIGDLLVAAPSAGRAMRASQAPAAGTVIGKALQSMDAGSGTIMMLVMLH
jgi:hypothetical protein